MTTNSLDPRFWDGSRWDSHAAFNTVSHLHVYAPDQAEGVDAWHLMVIECANGKFFIEDPSSTDMGQFKRVWYSRDRDAGLPVFFDFKDVALYAAIEAVAAKTYADKDALIKKYLPNYLPLALPPVKIVHIAPTEVWIENDFFGGRHVMMQHEGCEPFTYCSFHYNYTYTSNSGTLSAATEMALKLGAVEPIQIRSRKVERPSIEKVQKDIEGLQKLLKNLLDSKQ